jgi:DNA polymerase-3 subunit gamma/tau
VELDSGRFRGIDEIRSLCYKAYFSPVAGQRKVYLLDEAQQLTPEAWNALLKVLEESPEYLSIILCTTNGLNDGKIPETVVSRCQLYPFAKLKAQEIRAKLTFIANSEGIELDDNWINWVANFAQGNLRIAECELEKLIVATKANLVCV